MERPTHRWRVLVRSLQVARRSRGPHGARPAGALPLALAATALLLGGGAAYEVVAGDTLSGIAGRLGVTVDDLAGANGIPDPDLIYEGQVLQLPGDDGAASAGGADGTGATHVVEPGESLASIASRYGLTVEQLAQANGITDPNKLLAGALLRVAGEAPPTPGVPGSAAGGTHTVQPGETLSRIASRYGTTVSTLVDLNGLPDANHIVAGATLEVPSEGTGAAWMCPVPGAQFINDFGVAKPDGRFHEGVDLFAPRGIVIIAPVGGTVEHVIGERAGLQFVLHGDDDYTYIGTHLDAFGPDGRVEAGTPIGQVGDSGNARGAPPHLHLEMHHDGVVNPFPTLHDHCG